MPTKTKAATPVEPAEPTTAQDPLTTAQTAYDAATADLQALLVRRAQGETVPEDELATAGGAMTVATTRLTDAKEADAAAADAVRQEKADAAITRARELLTGAPVDAVIDAYRDAVRALVRLVDEAERHGQDIQAAASALAVGGFLRCNVPAEHPSAQVLGSLTGHWVKLGNALYEAHAPGRYLMSAMNDAAAARHGVRLGHRTSTVTSAIANYVQPRALIEAEAYMGLGAL